MPRCLLEQRSVEQLLDRQGIQPGNVFIAPVTAHARSITIREKRKRQPFFQLVRDLLLVAGYSLYPKPSYPPGFFYASTLGDPDLQPGRAENVRQPTDFPSTLQPISS